MQKRLAFGVLSVLALLIAGTGVMQGAAINGSLPVTGSGVSQDGANLLVSTKFSDTLTITSGPGTGNYAVVPLTTDYGTFMLDLVTLGSGGGFSLTNATYGSFAATSGTIVGAPSASFLNVRLFGTYTPGPGIPGVDPGATELNLAFTQSGSSVSASGTLSSFAISPEPGTMALFGLGILGIAGVLRRKATLML
jgi:hypothetical protein